MGDIPKNLEAKWKKEHFATAEEAFARVAVEGQAAAGPSFFEKAKVEENRVATVLKAENN